MRLEKPIIEEESQIAAQTNCIKSPAVIGLAMFVNAEIRLGSCLIPFAE